MNGNPISFLPQDTINPAIQNLGQTLGAINQQKIGRQEDLQKKFQSLIEASYEDIWSRDQQEVTKDWEALRGEAINTFKKASELGGPVNQMEYTGLMKKHKELIRKVETARAAKLDYAKAIDMAAKLKSDEKLAPGSLEAIEQEKMNPKSIYDRKPFTSLIGEQYSPKEMLQLQDLIDKDVPMITKAGVMEGRYKTLKGKNPDDLAKAYSGFWDTSPTVQRMFPNKQAWVQQNVDTRGRLSEIDKPPSTNVNVYNNGGFNPNFKPRFHPVEVNGRTELQFNAGTNHGLIQTGNIAGTDGKTALEGGDLFVPGKTITRNGVKYITGSKLKKGSFTDAQLDAAGNIIGYKTAAGATATPVEIPLDAVNDQLESSYFNSDNQGNLDLSPWDNIGYKAGDYKAPTSNTVRQYEFDGDLYSYDELVGAGVDVKKQIKQKTIKLKAK